MPAKQAKPTPETAESTEATAHGRALIRDRILGLERLAPAELKPHPENWRVHPGAQRDALRAVREHIGVVAAAVAYRDPEWGLTLLDGHMRADESAADGTTLPVLVLDVDRDEARVVLRTLDAISTMSETDARRANDLALRLTVREDRRLRPVLAHDRAAEREARRDARDRARAAQVEEPEAPESRADPVPAAGDIWHLGNHSLYVGDSLAEGNLPPLGERVVDCVVTDPPYAIFGSSTGVGSDLADDKMVRPFFAQLFRRLRRLVKSHGHIYVHCDWRSYPALAGGAQEARVSLKNLLIWDKQRSGLGAAYSNAYEAIAFLHNKPEQEALGTNKADRHVRTVALPNLIRVAYVPGRVREHHAQKPVALLEQFIAASTDPGDTVLDLFAGAGSTIMACEATGRSAVAAEIDPVFADVAIRRWMRETGHTATLTGGATWSQVEAKRLRGGGTANSLGS